MWNQKRKEERKKEKKKKNTELLNTKNRLVVARGRQRRWAN